jgi:hypothetical protein
VRCREADGRQHGHDDRHGPGRLCGGGQQVAPVPPECHRGGWQHDGERISRDGQAGKRRGRKRCGAEAPAGLTVDDGGQRGDDNGGRYQEDGTRVEPGWNPWRGLALADGCSFSDRGRFARLASSVAFGLREDGMDGMSVWPAKLFKTSAFILVWPLAFPVCSAPPDARAADAEAVTIDTNFTVWTPPVRLDKPARAARASVVLMTGADGRVSPPAGSAVLFNMIPSAGRAYRI